MDTIKSLTELAMASIAAAVYAVVVIPVLLVGLMLLATQAAAVGATAAAVVAAECAPFLFAAGGGPAGSAPQIGEERFTGEQLANAQTIVTVAEHRRLPRRAAVLALATAMVESDLRNLGYGDRDSLGLFQQRPSQGWGSPEQILNPVYAANQFYDHLLALPGWQTMPPGVAEQAVQRSAFPERYGPREPAAAALVERFWRGPDNPTPPPADADAGTPSPINYSFGACPDTGRGNLDVDELDPKSLPKDYTPPADPTLHAAVAYALAQVGKPYVWGAEGPDAFDCSGLMQAAWANAGVAISRTTSTQVHDGVAVASLSQVRPGDLVFIPGADGTPAAPGHVGMYVGDGYMVDAYDEDHGVILTTLDSWASKVVAIRRVATGGQQPPAAGGDPRT